MPPKLSNTKIALVLSVVQLAPGGALPVAQAVHLLDALTGPERAPAARRQREGGAAPASSGRQCIVTCLLHLCIPPAVYLGPHRLALGPPVLAAAGPQHSPPALPALLLHLIYPVPDPDMTAIFDEVQYVVRVLHLLNIIVKHRLHVCLKPMLLKPRCCPVWRGK